MANQTSITPKRHTLWVMRRTKPMAYQKKYTESPIAAPINKHTSSIEPKRRKIEFPAQDSSKSHKKKHQPSNVDLLSELVSKRQNQKLESKHPRFTKISAIVFISSRMCIAYQGLSFSGFFG